MGRRERIGGRGQEARVEAKAWYRSRTIWVNGVVVVVVMLTAVRQEMSLTQQQVEVIAVALATLNVVLRLLTTQPVGRGRKRGD